VTAIVETIIDATHDPDAKTRLLSGQTNVIQCPHCGTASTVATPLLYHDANAELLISFVPMQLGMSQNDQEKVTGDLLKELMAQMPQESIKGYVFQPRQALTMQGMIQQILEADGVTPEMLQEQQERMDLLQQLLQSDPTRLADFVREHDEKIDEQFFQTMSLFAAQMAQTGQNELAQQMIMLQGQIAELSSYGRELLRESEAQQQVIEEVVQAVRALGENAQREDFLNLALDFADEDEKLKALVGLVRPAFDYIFFQEMTLRIGQSPAAERERLEVLRERLNQLTEQVDQQADAAMQRAAGLLRVIASSEDSVQAIRANMPMIDNTFMEVLLLNVREAEKRGDGETATRLKEIYAQVVEVLQENMAPELQFVNQLLSTETDDEVQQMIADHADEYGEVLFEVLEMVEDVMSSRNDDAMLQKVAFLRDEITRVLN